MIWIVVHETMATTHVGESWVLELRKERVVNKFHHSLFEFSRAIVNWSPEGAGRAPPARLNTNTINKCTEIWEHFKINLQTD
jgi:hypothetical protein